MRLDLDRFDHPETIRQLLLLTKEPGYVVLCDLLQAFLDNLQDDMYEAHDSRTALRHLRSWQIFRHVLTVLRTEPQRIKEALELGQQKELLETEEYFDQGPRLHSTPPPNAVTSRTELVNRLNEIYKRKMAGAFGMSE